ncbi:MULTISPECIES: inositol monophosphatase family protein [unclassified Streptomyces]|uniref:inositol monophosphatase family protein n=1 Tax=unclassified Streptomyces TaxID=2593676 RepID=UPI002E2FA4E3|nr:inositol monophosphatase family protein [Streptomyces sp. NBC_01431]
MGEVTGEQAVTVARSAVRQAGTLLSELAGTSAADARLKHGYEVVTEADLRSDELIRAVIRAEHPDHRVISEENWEGWQEGMFDGPTWVVDPLDGSVNFAHNHPYVSVSVAYVVDGVVQAGAVCAPFLGQVFDAVRGGGARCNGEPIAASATATLADALVGTGFPHERTQLDGVMERIRRLVSHCRDIRRAGSPALDICWVAAGRLDAHTESLGPWDVAAAGLIATEAGACRTSLLPESIPLPSDLAGAGFMVAAPGVYEELVRLLSK